MIQNTPKGLRLQIGFFGRRNAGKSSLLNALAGQDVVIVSDVPGTTTDPVEKPMELLACIEKRFELVRTQLAGFHQSKQVVPFPQFAKKMTV